MRRATYNAIGIWVMDCDDRGLRTEILLDEKESFLLAFDDTPQSRLALAQLLRRWVNDVNICCSPEWAAWVLEQGK